MSVPAGDSAAAGTAPEVITFGETMALFVGEQAGPLQEAVSFRRYIAGAESNVAIGLSRLGVKAGWFSRLGDDAFGRSILFRLRGEGVDVSRTQVDSEAPTAVFFRERREMGPIEVLYYRRGSAAGRMSPLDLDEKYLRSGKFLHLTGITPALSGTCREATFAAAEIGRSAKIPVVLDPNIRLKLWSREDAKRVLRELCQKVDIVLPGAEEAELLTGKSDPIAAAKEILSLGPSMVVVKVGAEGAIAVDRETVTRSPALSLSRIVDPIGAGDAFAAGYLCGQVKQLGLEKSLALANRCGAMATMVSGDIEGFPRWSEVSDGFFSGDVRR